MSDSPRFVSGTTGAVVDQASLDFLRALLAQQPSLFAITGDLRQAERLAGLSNLVFGLETERGRFVLRVPAARSAGLTDRTGEFHNLRLAAGAGLAVPPLFFEAQGGLMLMKWQDVRSGKPAPEHLGAVIARLHGLPHSFMRRLNLSELLSSLTAVVEDCGAYGPELAGIRTVLVSLADLGGEGELLMVPSHCDLSPGNILKTPEGVQLIDFEFSAMAPPAWDLAYALLENGFTGDQERAFLAGYAEAGGRVPGTAVLRDMMQRCDGVSALWALEQAAYGNDRADFSAFARARIQRMHMRLAA